MLAAQKASVRLGLLKCSMDLNKYMNVPTVIASCRLGPLFQEVCLLPIYTALFLSHRGHPDCSASSLPLIQCPVVEVQPLD